MRIIVGLFCDSIFLMIQIMRHSILDFGGGEYIIKAQILNSMVNEKKENVM